MAQASQPCRVQAPAAAPADGDAARPALLVLLPGAMLGPKDYDALLQAIQAQTSSGVALWVSIAAIDWQHMQSLGFSPPKWHEYAEGLVRQAVEAAQAEGFPLQGKPEARMENVFVAMHSMAAAFYPSSPMKHCGGAVLLGAVVDGSTSTVADAAAAPRPLMHILGAMDGQLRAPRAAWTAACLAPLAAQYGARHFAVQHPFALIPGMNHAQFSNGAVNWARGDISSDVPLGTQSEAVAGLIAAFVSANHPAATPESTHHAVEQLLQATTASFDLLSPFAEACGRGSPAALLAAAHAPGQPSAAAHSYGAERLPPSTPDRNGYAHPGELAAAEAFARAAQRRMLAAGMPDNADAEAVRVAVTVHSSLDSFIYSQPTAFQTETPAGKEWVVHCHVYLFWEYYQPGMESSLKPMSPQYFLKLKKGGVVALAMGLEGGGEGVATAADINADTLAAALKAAPAAFVESYKRRGKQLSFAPDRDVSKDIKTPVDWMHMPLAFEPDGEAGLALTAPSVTTPVAPLPSYDRGPGRFTGNHYIKCCSAAWMHEWVMIEGLRRAAQPA